MANLLEVFLHIRGYRGCVHEHLYVLTDNNETHSSAYSLYKQLRLPPSLITYIPACSYTDSSASHLNTHYFPPVHPHKALLYLINIFTTEKLTTSCVCSLLSSTRGARKSWKTIKGEARSEGNGKGGKKSRKRHDDSNRSGGDGEGGVG